MEQDYLSSLITAFTNPRTSYKVDSTGIQLKISTFVVLNDSHGGCVFFIHNRHDYL